MWNPQDRGMILTNPPQGKSRFNPTILGSLHTQGKQSETHYVSCPHMIQNTGKGKKSPNNNYYSREFQSIFDRPFWRGLMSIAIGVWLNKLSLTAKILTNPFTRTTLLFMREFFKTFNQFDDEVITFPIQTYEFPPFPLWSFPPNSISSPPPAPLNAPLTQLHPKQASRVAMKSLGR